MRAPKDSSGRQNAPQLRFCVSHGVVIISFGREKLEGISIFSTSAFFNCCWLKSVQNDPNKHIWVHLGALLGSSWGILMDLGSFLGPTQILVEPLLAPQNRKKSGQRVSPEFHGFPGVLRGAKRVPKRVPKGTLKTPKWSQKWLKYAYHEFCWKLENRIPLLHLARVQFGDWLGFQKLT